MPSTSESWNFDWQEIFKRENTQTYVLTLNSEPTSIQGILHLKVQAQMLIMDLIELAPHNIGRKNKKYNRVAGCLIAFACREAFKLEGNYKGFLTFESKTKLIDWYIKNYNAKIAIGQKMCIEPMDGKELINAYLN